MEESRGFLKLHFLNIRRRQSLDLATSYLFQTLLQLYKFSQVYIRIALFNVKVFGLEFLFRIHVIARFDNKVLGLLDILIDGLRRELQQLLIFTVAVSGVQSAGHSDIIINGSLQFDQCSKTLLFARRINRDLYFLTGKIEVWSRGDFIRILSHFIAEQFTI